MIKKIIAAAMGILAPQFVSFWFFGYDTMIWFTKKELNYLFRYAPPAIYFAIFVILLIEITIATHETNNKENETETEGK